MFRLWLGMENFMKRFQLVLKRRHFSCKLENFLWKHETFHENLAAVKFSLKIFLLFSWKFMAKSYYERLWNGERLELWNFRDISRTFHVNFIWNVARLQARLRTELERWSVVLANITSTWRFKWWSFLISHLSEPCKIKGCPILYPTYPAQHMKNLNLSENPSDGRQKVLIPHLGQPIGTVADTI